MDINELFPEGSSAVLNIARTALQSLPAEIQQAMWCMLTEQFAGNHPVESLPKPVFHTWVRDWPNCPVELAILRQGESGYEILLAQRGPNDTEFPGQPWHWPGSVIMPGQTIAQKLQVILDREVAGASVTTPQFVTIYEHVARGSYRQHEDCFLHTCLLQSEWNEAMSATTRAKFFALDAIPENTIESHKEYCRLLNEWLLIKDAMESEDSLRATLQNGRITGMPRPW